MMFWGCAMLWFRVKYLFINSGLKSEYWPWVKTQVSGGNEKSELTTKAFGGIRFLAKAHESFRG